MRHIRVFSVLFQTSLSLQNLLVFWWEALLITCVCVLISDTCWHTNHPLKLFFFETIRKKKKKRESDGIKSSFHFIISMFYSRPVSRLPFPHSFTSKWLPFCKAVTGNGVCPLNLLLIDVWENKNQLRVLRSGVSFARPEIIWKISFSKFPIMATLLPFKIIFWKVTKKL